MYYTPSKIGRYDYIINNFKDELKELKSLWQNEFSKAIDVIKTPKQVQDETRLANLADGIYDYDEANTVALFAGFKREQPYRYVIKSIYAQFYHQMTKISTNLSFLFYKIQKFDNNAQFC